MKICTDLEIINIKLKGILFYKKYVLYSLLALVSIGKLKRNLKEKRFYIANKKFSNVFSLGDRCATTDFLIKTNLRKWASPFDWMGGGNLEKRINLITSRFSNFLSIENLICINEIDGHGKYRVDDTFLGFRFRHDFPCCDINLHYSDVYDKYQRRISRMYSKSLNGDILIFYIETKNNSPDLTSQLIDRLIEIRDALQAKQVTFFYGHSCSINENGKYQRITLKNGAGSIFKFNIYLDDDYSNKPLSKKHELDLFKASHRLFDLT